MRIIFFILLLSFATISFSAKPIDVSKQSPAFLNSFSANNTATTLKQISHDTDFNQSQHIHLVQLYKGYPVWSGHVMMHIVHGIQTMNGLVYQDLETDLQSAPAYLFSEPQFQKALEQAIQIYQKKTGIVSHITQSTTDMIIYLDKNNIAHWGFLIHFLATVNRAAPVKPAYILDAITLHVYQEWNEIKTIKNETTIGGFGGNLKIGKIIYDELNAERDPHTKMCYLENKDVVVKDANHDEEEAIHFLCDRKNKSHGNVYWDADKDAINGAYSPGNDALYVGKVVKNLYQDWYGIPVLSKKDEVLKMVVHMPIDNAYWDGEQMTFGDGVSDFYPLVSIGVAAHEISHGFTEHHSGLIYAGESGGINESFSDMAVIAAKVYAKQPNHWQIGEEITKGKNKPLRYIDEPTKDCDGRQPGDQCSINNIEDYNDNVEAHYSSGIFNKLFYLLSNSPGWDVKKAFDVMVHANRYYWTPTSTFQEAACGVIHAAEDYQYPISPVKHAIHEVKIDVDSC